MKRDPLDATNAKGLQSVLVFEPTEAQTLKLANPASRRRTPWVGSDLLGEAQPRGLHGDVQSKRIELRIRRNAAKRDRVRVLIPGDPQAATPNVINVDVSENTADAFADATFYLIAAC